ncbi:hypothetical protein PILCRDRAFT_9900 [Piloderma croceum F 1598]|uniref:Uncharacterized protein n=1 Tax=Piloderma croceum (strain F 1598) TaxID=765440 RepID=A0A0C3F5N7_PILCF|nr:hypothetical protein PILCRDRAFT_9900 [Piloderma croceum F 1598]
MSANIFGHLPTTKLAPYHSLFPDGEAIGTFVICLVATAILIAAVSTCVVACADGPVAKELHCFNFDDFGGGNPYTGYRPYGQSTVSHGGKSYDGYYDSGDHIPVARWDQSYLWNYGDAESGESQLVSGIVPISRLWQMMAKVTRKRLDIGA